APKVQLTVSVCSLGSIWFIAAEITLNGTIALHDV
ncbi:uncharacterized protein METZ01_LOCUS73818, partial [marine metagenome]